MAHINLLLYIYDNAYGMIKWKQECEGLPKYGLDYKNPNFVTYAESFEATSYRPESIVEFEKNLKTALNTKGVQIIDLAIDYSLNHEILNVKIK